MLNNLGVKIGALCVALLVWLHVVTEKTYTYTFRAALKPTHLAEDLIVANELPKHLHVTIKGNGKRLFWLMFSELEIVLDLQNAIQSKSRYRFEVTDVVIPRDIDVTITEIGAPDFVDVDIDRLVEKQVPVFPRLSTNPANGYVIVGPVLVNPDSVTMKGPRRFVERTDTLYTQSETVRRAKRRVHRELPLIEPEGINVTIAPSSVIAEVDVQKMQRRVINDVPVVLVHVPTNKKVTLDSSTITLTIEGGADLLASLKPEDLHVSVDYRQTLRGSTDVLTPIILTPPNVSWVEAQPQTFNIIN
ncbi:MAG: hypothetical protein JSV84_02770 [Gemmatimonadota bacterium]|nr:MAG: hypothetical protein JSV84_02770 [Gemmatimonadota bacterium]